MIKILIVEDDPNIAKLMEATVAIGGYESEVCNNGAEAFENAKKEAVSALENVLTEAKKIAELAAKKS